MLVASPSSSTAATAATAAALSRLSADAALMFDKQMTTQRCDTIWKRYRVQCHYFFLRKVVCVQIKGVRFRRPESSCSTFAMPSPSLFFAAKLPSPQRLCANTHARAHTHAHTHTHTHTHVLGQTSTTLLPPGQEKRSTAKHAEESNRPRFTHLS